MFDFEGNPKPLILAEIGQAHEGSLDLAKSLIDLAAEAGADAIKVQVHLPAFESTLDESFRVPGIYQDASRFEYWIRTSFSLDAWSTLRRYTADAGLMFIPSVFSLEAIKELGQLAVDCWKVGSGEVLQPWFLEAIMSMDQPTIFSSGMSSLREIKALAEISSRLPYRAILQCTSKYPAPLEETGVETMLQIANEWGVDSGLSDHSGSISPSIYALSLGARFIEVHVTPHRGLRGFDSSSSVTFEQLGQIVDFRDDLLRLRLRGKSKDAVCEELMELRTVFGRSIAAVQQIPSGTKITRKMLSFKKPGGGIPPENIDHVVGKTAISEINPKHIIRRENLA